jgi:predicted negative regulator of RcsB-dependent stress response
MDNYETEEQQVEAIKKWWSENYKMVIAATIIGLGSIVGIQQWKQNKAFKAHSASMEYDQILKAVNDSSTENISQQVKGMQADYAEYPYAALAGLLEAKTMVDSGKLEDAQKQYQWVIDNSQSQSIQHIARISMATVMSAQGKHEDALKVLDVEQGKFKASYLETKGDIMVALNRINEAKAAYDQALQAYAAIGANAQILKVKRNDLGNS